MGCMKNDDWASAGGDDRAVCKSDPLALVLTQEFVADSPVRCLVLAPIGMDLASNFGGQSVSQAFHRSPRRRKTGIHRRMLIVTHSEFAMDSFKASGIQAQMKRRYCAGSQPKPPHFPHS